jgi:hypothetical protein
VEKKWQCNGAVHKLFVDFEKAYDSVMIEVLYNNFTPFGIAMKCGRLIKMCSNNTCNKVRIGKHLPDEFPIQNGVKEGDALSSFLFKFS